MLGKIATTVATEIPKQLISKYLLPKLDSIIEDNDLKNELCKDIEYKFETYLARSLSKHLYMDTIVFKNQQKHIDELYIPLTLLKNTYSDETEKIIITGLNKGFLEHYKKVLIVDTAGMGKSTLLKYLFISCIRENGGLPILIELRRLSSEDTILDYILKELNGITGEIDKKYLKALIERGDFIMFLDGYDEINEEMKSDITTKLEDFSSEAGNNIFVMSSREESSLSCFGDFQRFTIQKLSKEEAFELIRKYDNQGERSKLLIKKIEEEDNLEVIQEFLANPLMVSLLYKAFEYKEYIPYKKHLFYRQVYNALFEDHDMTKGGHYIHKKNSELDIEDFHRVTRCIGYLTALQGKVSLNYDEFIQVIGRAIQLTTAVTTAPHKIAKDLVKVVPLFIEDGLEYRWTHKSFQDYFAAAYICKDLKSNQGKIWEKLISIDGDKYFNILDFCYDMDIKSFRRYVIKPFIEKYITHCDKTYNEGYSEGYSEVSLNARRTVLFLWNNINVIRKDVDDEIKPGELFDKFFKDRLGNHIKERRTIWREKIGVGADESNETVLLKLLYNKNEKVVKKSAFASPIDELIEYLEEGEYQLNDDKRNILNSIVYFDMLTYIILESINRERRLYLDYKACLKLREEIDNEEKLEEMEILEMLLEK